MADFVTEEAERAVFAVELLARIVRIFRERVHDAHRLQPPGAAVVARVVERLHADARDVVRHSPLARERVGQQRLVGEDDQLIELVRMRGQESDGSRR